MRGGSLRHSRHAADHLLLPLHGVSAAGQLWLWGARLVSHEGVRADSWSRVHMGHVGHKRWRQALRILPRLWDVGERDFEIPF